MQEKYTLVLQLYLVAFIGVAAWFRVRLRRQELLLKNSQLPVFLLLWFVAAFVVRGYMASEVLGFSTDVSTFTSWARTAAQDLPRFYQNVSFCDYPPLYIYVLAIVGKMIDVPGMGGAGVFLVKLPAILADLAIAGVTYYIASTRVRKDMAAIIAVLVAMNPAAILNSAIWGQVDSVFAFMLLLAIWTIRTRHIAVTSCLFGLLFMLKPQAVFFMPILLFELLRRKRWQEWLYALLAGVATVYIVALPVSRDPLFMFHLYMGTAEGYKYATLNAPNVFGLIGANLATDDNTLFILPYSIWGLLMDAALVIWTGWLYLKSKAESAPFFIATLLNIGAFMVSVRMHERYMFPTLVLLPILYLLEKDRRLLDLCGLFIVTFTVGVHDVLYRMMTLNYPHIDPKDRLFFLLSAMNLAGLVWAGLIAHQRLLPKHNVVQHYSHAKGSNGKK